MITGGHEEDLVSFGDDVLTVPSLKDLQEELLSECIEEQIKNPFYTSTDFLEEFHEGYEEDLEDVIGDDVEVQKLNDIANEFYLKTLKLLDNKFDLGFDVDNVYSMSGDTLRNFCEGMYEFFIVNYRENIVEYLRRRILDMKDVIVEEIVANMKDKSDVTTEMYSKRIQDRTFALLLSNIRNAIIYIKDLDIDASEFIEFFDMERYGVAHVKYAISANLLNGEFVRRFLDEMIGSTQDISFDMIALEVQQAIHAEYIRLKKAKENK